MVSKMKCKEFELLIDYYLKGELGDKKQEEFEEHYFTCDSCFLNLKIKEKILNKEISIKNNEKNKLISLILKPAMVFAAVLIIFVSVLFINNNNTKHFNKNFINIVNNEEIPIYMIKEQRGEFKEDKTFEKAIEFFEKKEYLKSLNLLNKVENQNLKINFLKAICYLKLMKPKKAIKEFDKIIKTMHPSYYDEALYYKSLALLIMNKKEEAKKILNQLKRMFSPYALKSEIIIKKIN